MSVLVFLMPYESGEKIGFVITVFVSQAFNILLISEFIPVNSIQLPAVSRFCFFSILITWVSLFISVTILAGQNSPHLLLHLSQPTQNALYQTCKVAARYLLVDTPQITSVDDSKLLLFFQNDCQLTSQEDMKRGEQLGAEQLADEVREELWRFALRCLDRVFALLFVLLNFIALKFILPYYFY